MAHITLFIDESGNFFEKEEWLVAGVAIPVRYHELSTKLLESTMRGFPKSVGLTDRSDCHLSELRQRYSSTGLPREQTPEQIAEVLFNRFAQHSPKYVTAMGRAGAQNAREETYRLLLQDVIWLTQSVLFRDTDIETMDVVVSSRTIDGILATDELDIERDVLQPLHTAVQHGLVSLGMYDLLHHKRIKLHLVQANDSWGTVVADFVANLVHNRGHDDCQALINRFEIETFESLNSMEERRALVAESDSDIGSALYLWSLAESSQHSSHTRVQAGFQRLAVQIVNSRHALAPLYIVDGLIERLHRCRLPDGDTGRLRALQTLCTNLEDIYQQKGLAVRSTALALYRLRAYMTLLCARLGQSSKGEQLQSKQPEVEPVALAEPSSLELLFTNISAQVELKLTMLDYGNALAEAHRARRLAQNLQSHWEGWMADMCREGVMPDTSLTGTIIARAQGQLHRVQVYHLTPDEKEGLLGVAQEIRASGDIHDRERQVLVHALLKAGQAQQAVPLQVMKIASGRHTLWDIYWLLRSINDSALMAPESRPCAELIVQYVIPALQQVDPDGIIMSLVFREAWLLCQLYPECGLRAYDGLQQGAAQQDGHSAERLVRQVSYDVFPQWLNGQHIPLPHYLLGTRSYPPEALQQALAYMTRAQESIDKMKLDEPHQRLLVFRQWLPW